LNEKYGVGGSPTLVINDTVVVVDSQDCPGKDIKCTVISDFNRSPEKVKEAICNAFLNSPPECQQNLSSTSTSPGFGLDSGSSSSGKCE
jgi:hypothetical protein